MLLKAFSRKPCVGSFKHQFDSQFDPSIRSINSIHLQYLYSITLIALVDRRDHCECEFSYKSLPAWFHIVFSQTSDQIETNISALPVKNNTFRWFLNKIRRGFIRQQVPKILSCVLQYVFLLFQVSLGAFLKKPLLGSLAHRFAWSFRKFMIKHVESIVQFCRRYPEIILPS